MFSDEAVVDRWLNDCPNGGFLLGFASHRQQEQIAPNDRGKVLGVYEFAAQKVFADDPSVIEPSWLDDPALHNAGGRFRWPFGLRAVRAWRFVRNDVMTRETLPDSRREGRILTRDMKPITARDLDLVNQYALQEVPVYQRPFQPLVLTEPNATPDGNYLLVCREESILSRIPGRRPGEFLYKLGISSDFDARCEALNNHLVARLFGLKLSRIWEAPAGSTDEARARERLMIDVGDRMCRLAAPGSGQREFFLGPEEALGAFIAAAGGARLVA
jgi:hypothetical protein